MDTLLQNILILETFKCGKKKCVLELSNMSRVIIITTGVGTVTYQDMKMWGKCVLEVVVTAWWSLSQQEWVQRAIATHWRKLLKLLGDNKIRLQQEMVLEGCLPGEQRWTRVGKGAREKVSRQREQLLQRKETKERAMHSGSSCLLSL